MIFNMSGGGVNTGIQLVAIENASALPEAAHESTVYVLTSQRIADVYVQVEKPESTTDGAAWVVIDTNYIGGTVQIGEKMRLPIKVVRIYSAEAEQWIGTNSYIHNGSEWICVAGCIQLFDGENFHSSVIRRALDSSTIEIVDGYLKLYNNKSGNYNTSMNISVSLDVAEYHTSMVVAKTSSSSPTFKVSGTVVSSDLVKDEWSSIYAKVNNSLDMSYISSSGDFYLKEWYIYK